MVWITLLFAAVAIGIGIRMGTKTAREQNQLIAEGKILRRQYDFAESAELFALSPADPREVAEAVQAFDYEDMRVRMQPDGENGFHFAGPGWTARLYRLLGPAQEAVYRFEFLKWKTRNGLLSDYVNMNKLLTAMEKMFLAMDPQTQVSTVKLETKTTHSVW